MHTYIDTHTRNCAGSKLQKRSGGNAWLYETSELCLFLLLVYPRVEVLFRRHSVCLCAAMHVLANGSVCASLRFVLFSIWNIIHMWCVYWWISIHAYIHRHTCTHTYVCTYPVVSWHPPAHWGGVQTIRCCDRRELPHHHVNRVRSSMCTILFAPCTCIHRVLHARYRHSSAKVTALGQHHDETRNSSASTSKQRPHCARLVKTYLHVFGNVVH